MYKLMKVVCVVTVIGCLGLMSVGCSSKKVTASSVWLDMSPELYSLTMNHGQLMNLETRVVDRYERSFHDDVNHLLLLEHPTRLHRYVAP